MICNLKFTSRVKANDRISCHNDRIVTQVHFQSKCLQTFVQSALVSRRCSSDSCIQLERSSLYRSGSTHHYGINRNILWSFCPLRAVFLTNYLETEFCSTTNSYRNRNQFISSEKATVTTSKVKLE